MLLAKLKLLVKALFAIIAQKALPDYSFKKKQISQFLDDLR